MKNIAKCKLFLLCLVAGVSLAACGGGFPFAQPLEIEQGNMLEREDIDRIETGMSQAQVEQILGRPVLEHPFAEERWDYIYRYSGADREDEANKRLTIFFEQGQVAEIEDHWPEDD
ncbi:hypothetical protein CKO08_02740 [Halorhodospira halochloris]|nr:hypothetical protein [Halorhodospira halochloris]